MPDIPNPILIIMVTVLITLEGVGGTGPLEGPRECNDMVDANPI